MTSKMGDSTGYSETISNFGLHPDLVALGILLLELSEKKLFREWWNEQLFPEAFPEDISSKARAAWRWYEHASERMTPKYCRAFRRCLNAHDLEIRPAKRMTLADEGFREAVFRHIVSYLEETYFDYIKPLEDSTLQLV
jgi:hypothetical protein